MYWLRCIRCGEEYPPESMNFTCEKCEGLLEVSIDFNAIKADRKTFERRGAGVWRYREFLPVGEDARIITLKEGGTPLYRAENLQDELGIKELYIKNEGANPTGSFKDRGMTLGVTKALEFGARGVCCASTGNTSASLAAYAARAQLDCLVLLPAGKIAIGKLSQAILHGAKVIAIKGNFDVALELVRAASERFGIYLLNSINPWRLEGQKTAAFEIIDQLGWQVPDRVIVPVGNCGNISAIWKGFNEFYKYGFTSTLPKMVGIQAEGASPVAHAFREGLDGVVPVQNPDTIATAIRIGAPVNAPKALGAVRKSGGLVDGVTDEEIIKAQRLLACVEGIGVEPASAASIAGLIKLLDSDEIDRDEKIVCVTTGHALKDPEAIFKGYDKPIEIEPKIEELERVLD
ncbi:MAG: threonine synthase [Candidatus Hydrothermarchaeaceae archaeon]